MIRPLLLLSLLVHATAAAGEEVDHARQYEICMSLARTEPTKAFDTAVAWEGLGGGAAARHCAAVALIDMGQPGEAARRLEDLATEIRADAPFKAEILAQAAQAWLLARAPDRAEAAVATALQLVPDDDGLLVDRAAARAARGDYAAAIADLDRAIALNAFRPEAFVFRASAHRMLENLDAAAADADRALALDPDHPEGLLERGIVRRLLQDEEGAREDWHHLVRVQPASAAARAARENLERMDLETSGGEE